MKKADVKRTVRIVLAVLALGVSAPEAKLHAEQPPPPPATPDPLDEFVPKEQVPADSIVAFPVDI